MKTKMLHVFSVLLCICLTFGVAGCSPKEPVQAESASKQSSETQKPDVNSSEPNSTASDDPVTSSVSDSDAASPETEDDPSGEDDEKPMLKKKYTVTGKPRVYVTTADSDVKFRRQAESAVKVYDAKKLNRKAGHIMDIDPNTKYQVIDGFGASLTDTSSYNISRMPASLRNDLMTKLFDPNKGIGLSFLRQPIGTSDFNVEMYTYDDMPEGQEDWELKNFSIERDKKYIIPLIKQAMSLNKDMKVVAACWTPPLWMKTANEWDSLNGVMLRSECYEVFSNYLVKYLKAYQAEGIPIYSLSAQNEPGYLAIPSTYYDGDMMARLINYNLAPALEDAGLNTKLWTWDFNLYEDSMLDFAGKVYDKIDGVAVHFYAGQTSAINKFKEVYPDAKVYLTEAAGMISPQRSQLFRQMKYMTETLRAGVSSYILWNITLDQERGPVEHKITENTIGLGLTEYNTETGKLTYNMDFYALAHLSKFIQPGAHVIESNDLSASSDGALYNIAALNKNGTVTVILANRSGEPETVKMVIGDKVIEYAVPGNSAVTVTFDANTY